MALDHLQQGSSIGGPREKKVWPTLFQIMWLENSNAASESDINLHHVYTGRELRNATKYNIMYYNHWCWLHWMHAAPQVKSPTVNC